MTNCGLLVTGIEIKISVGPSGIGQNLFGSEREWDYIWFWMILMIL